MVETGWIDISNITPNLTFTDGTTQIQETISWIKTEGQPPVGFSQNPVSIPADTKNTVLGNTTQYSYFCTIDFSWKPIELLKYLTSVNLYSGVVNGGYTGTYRKTYYNGKIFMYQWNKVANSWVLMDGVLDPTPYLENGKYNSVLVWIILNLNLTNASFELLYPTLSILFKPDTSYVNANNCNFGIWGQDDNFFPDGYGYTYFSCKMVNNWQNMQLKLSDANKFAVISSWDYGNRGNLFDITASYSDDDINYTEVTLVGNVEETSSPDEFKRAKTIFDIGNHKYWYITITTKTWAIVYGFQYQEKMLYDSNYVDINFNIKPQTIIYGESMPMRIMFKII